jgi:hypothetical protein
MENNEGEEIAVEVQQLFRATPLLLVGSGFSCGFGLPGMGEVGDHLCTSVGVRLATMEARSLWSTALPSIQTNFEAGLNMIASGATGRQEVITALREEIARLIIARNRTAEAKILSSKDSHQMAPVRLLKRLFYGAPQNAECIPIITTNYDTLIELFADLAELPVDTGFAGLRRRLARQVPIFQTQYRRILSAGSRNAKYEHRPIVTVRLLKPHGSITWQSTDGEPIEVLNDFTDAPRSIVVPGPSKYEDALVNNLFDTMRGEMNQAINRAAALLCIGFGFNDEHLQGVIRSRLEARMPTGILVQSFTDSIEAVIDRYPHVLAIQQYGSGAEIRIRGKTTKVLAPVWELDCFLKTYLG